MWNRGFGDGRQKGDNKNRLATKAQRHEWEKYRDFLDADGRRFSGL